MTDGQPISREGRRELRTAIIELGKGLAQNDSDFADYRSRLVAREKPSKVVNIALGRRAHRLAFAMMRDQTPYDPAAWRAGVAAGRTVMDDTWSARCDVAAPPPTSSMTTNGKEHNPTPDLVGARPVVASLAAGTRTNVDSSYETRPVRDLAF